MTASVMGWGDPMEYKVYDESNPEDMVSWMEDRNFQRTIWGANYGFLRYYPTSALPPPLFIVDGTVFAFAPNSGDWKVLKDPLDTLDPERYSPAPVYVEADGA